MRFHFEPEPDHAKRVFDAILPIDHETARDDMQHFAVLRNRNRPRRIEGAFHVIGFDAALAAPGRDYAAAVDGRNVRTGHVHKCARDFVAARSLGLFDRRADGSTGIDHIDDDALLDPAGGRDAHADDAQIVIARFAHERTDFGGPDIDADNCSFHKSLNS